VYEEVQAVASPPGSIRRREMAWLRDRHGRMLDFHRLPRFDAVF
jgi:hypothetical protein